MTAYDMCMTILDINEGIEYLKSKNTDSEPDLQMCCIVDVLDSYRDMLISTLRQIKVESIEVNVGVSGRVKETDNQ